MNSQTPSLDLVEYVETKILPQYAKFDRSHNLVHANRVIKASLELANTIGADINMVYVVAAYHDLGLKGPRAVHHILSGKILLADTNLKKWFTPSQIAIMKEAVEDHRASASRAPKSIYGKIVAEADRDLDPMSVFRRTIQFNLNTEAQKNKAEHFASFCHHLDEKYSASGYLRVWIPGSANEKKLNELRNIISNPTRLREIFNQIYDEEVATRTLVR